MLDLIGKFVNAARISGLRISTSEVLDCVDQVKYVDPLDEIEFRTLLRSNFAKSRRDQAKFDQLYHLFFHELQVQENISRSESLSGLIDDILEAMQNKANGDLTNKVIMDFLKGDPAGVLEFMRQLETDMEGSSRNQAGVPNFSLLGRRLNMMFKLFDVKEAVSAYLKERRMSIDWQTRQDLESYFNQRVDTIFRLMKEDADPDNFSLKKVESRERRLSQLGQRPFGALSAREIEDMRDVIDHFVRKLKDTLHRRYAKKNRGVLDVKKTMRLAAGFQGIPIKVAYRYKPYRKGKIVTLCDVSGSVWSAARFMLNLLYSLQDCFMKVRSFIFVAGLCEVTSIFEEHDINDAIEKVINETDLEYDVDTDYGMTLRAFKQDHYDILDKKTTVIIVGDGRTNYRNPEEKILEEIRDRCRRIIWLNPEPERFWNSGDNVMRTYEKYCNEVRVVGNIDQLLVFIKDLVL